MNELSTGRFQAISFKTDANESLTHNSFKPIFHRGRVEGWRGREMGRQKSRKQSSVSWEDPSSDGCERPTDRQHVADLTAWHVGKSVGCEVATPTEIREQNCRSIPRIVKDEHPLTAEDNWRYSCEALIMCWRKTLAGWQFPSYTMHPSSELSENEKQQQQHQRFPFWAQSAARHWCRLSHLVATIL